MPAANKEELRQALEAKKEELTIRLDRIHANLRRGTEADSKERAKQFEDNEVCLLYTSDAADDNRLV